LYGHEPWSHKLREEHRLKALDKKVLRRISGLKIEEVTGRRRLHNLYASSNIIMVIKSEG
jgi:hypothetical protein